MQVSHRLRFAVVVVALLALAAPAAAVAAKAPKNAKAKKPYVTSFSPTSAAARSKVVVRGKGFVHVKKVEIGAMHVAFKVDSAKKLTMTIPKKAKSGKILVITSAGRAQSAGALKIKP